MIGDGLCARGLPCRTTPSLPAQPLRLAGFARPETLLAADGEVEMTLPAPKPGQKA